MELVYDQKVYFRSGLRPVIRHFLSDFVDAYNYARRLKTLNSLTPFEYICKIWTSEPDRFIINPTHHKPGLNIQRSGQVLEFEFI